MKYNIINKLPVARFWYKGNHTHPVRRTVLITEQNDNTFTGYELREGNAVRTANRAPVKTYVKEKIALTSSLRLDNPLRKTTKNKSTLVRKPLLDLIAAGI